MVTNYKLSNIQVLRRGAHVDDRDGLTDMTLLHYACKAGAGLFLHNTAFTQLLYYCNVQYNAICVVIELSKYSGVK